MDDVSIVAIIYVSGIILFWFFALILYFRESHQKRMDFKTVLEELKKANSNPNENNYINLKPCPFCGGEAELLSSLYEENGENKECYWTLMIRCIKCGAETKIHSIGGRNSAISAWNQRVKEVQK